MAAQFSPSILVRSVWGLERFTCFFPSQLVLDVRKTFGFGNCPKNPPKKSTVGGFFTPQIFWLLESRRSKAPIDFGEVLGGLKAQNDPWGPWLVGWFCSQISGSQTLRNQVNQFICQSTQALFVFDCSAFGVSRTPGISKALLTSDMYIYRKHLRPTYIGILMSHERRIPSFSSIRIS